MQQESRKEQEEEVRPPQPTAPTEGMLRSIWNEFAPTFAQEARWTDQVAHTLAAHLQLGSAQQAILEIGSGAGGGTEIICRAKPENVRVVATDLSTEFIAIAKKRLEGKAEVEFVEANAEKLPFDDASFDRYMASFVLHLVTDPKSMLAECKRVLQAGKGMAAFSVWGRKEHSPHFTIVPEVAKRLGIDLTQVGGAKPEMRSNFHLGDDPAALRRMALEAGFSKAFTWYQFVPVDVTDGRGWAEKQMHCSPMIIKLMRTLPEEKAAEFKNALADAADEFYNNGNVVGMEALFLLALA